MIVYSGTYQRQFKHLALLLCLFFSIHAHVYGQNNLKYEQSKINTEDFKKAAKQANQAVDYSDEFTPKPKKPKGQKGKEKGDSNAYNPNFNLPSNNKILYPLLIIVALALVGFVLYSIYKNNLLTKNYYESDEESDRFSKMNLNDPLQDFVGNGQYRLACRILYLKMLQDLVKLKAIIWRNEKTNWDYFNEARPSKIVNEQGLKSITQRYDNLWYGENEPNLTEFNEFQQLINQLNKP